MVNLPCLTCELPDCDDRDPRCQLRLQYNALARAEREGRDLSNSERKAKYAFWNELYGDGVRKSRGSAPRDVTKETEKIEDRSGQSKTARRLPARKIGVQPIPRAQPAPSCQEDIDLVLKRCLIPTGIDIIDAIDPNPPLSNGTQPIRRGFVAPSRSVVVVVEAAASEVAKIKGLGLKNLFGNDRRRRIAHARQDAMAVAHARGVTKIDIARVYKVDHSTVIYGIRQSMKRIGVAS